ncbi:MAG: fructose-6-phosphate aldolase [bacterium]
MKFFIDTANIDQIRDANELGILDGVTTNPSLVAREGRDHDDLVAEICEVVGGDVSAEVLATETEGMVDEARRLAAIADNIVVKLPTTPDGLKACRILSAEGIKVNMTLIFNPIQALMCAKAGAAYVSPFVGRLDDIQHEGMYLVQQLVTIFQNYGFDTEILVASVRHPLHVVEASELGADVVTVPHAVIRKLLDHPLTDSGLERFLADARESGRS